MFPDGDKGHIETVHLGQFTDEHAETISAALEDAGIHHWQKSTGRFTRVVFGHEWGTRLFVDKGRLDESAAIAKGILDEK